jgi:hypothetical protein
MSKKYFLYKSTIVASLAGFLFGFDTVVISGAEQTIQSLWGLNSSLHGLAISMALGIFRAEKNLALDRGALFCIGGGIGFCA